MYTQNIEDLIQQLETNDRNLKTRILKDISKYIDWATTNDLNKLTAYLLRTNDVEINFKIYVLLGLAITSNPQHRSSLAKSSGLYAKANYLLSKGLLTGSVGLLNFLTALVFVEGGEGNTLSEANNVATFAKHAIRTSGCLGQMNNYFLNKFLCTDIWRPLCRCLAECCRSVPRSQKETSQLLPRCIQELTRNKNEEVILLVQAILENHQLNKVKFLQFQGIHCFTTELLQMSQGLHLLCTLTENCQEAIEAATASEINKTLQDLASMFHVGSELEKWRSLALYYLSSSDRPVIPTASNNTTNNIQLNRPNTISVSEKVKKNNKKQEIIEKLKSIQNNDINDTIFDQSFELFQQQFYTQINKVDAVTKPFVPENKFLTHKQNTRRDKFPMNTSEIMQSANFLNDTNEWIKSGFECFSSLPFGDNTRNRHMSISNSQNNMAGNSDRRINFDELSSEFKNNFDVKSQTENSCQTSFDDGNTTRNMISFRSRGHDQRLNKLSFQPRLTSTPKDNLKQFDQMFNLNSQDTPMDKTMNLCNIRYNDVKKKKSYLAKNKSVNQYVSRQNSSRKSRSRINKTLGDGSVAKKNENKSFITSVLNVTTFGLFGRVKNLLTSSATLERQKRYDSALTATESNTSDSDSSHVTESTIFNFDSDNNDSFLEQSLVIMKGKFNNEKIQKHNNKKHTNEHCESKNFNGTNNVACATCNDTLKLTRKVNKNKHLKEIIKTLQVGVKKHGCNFKKIRRAYWPSHESITSQDLSHLYHKIIAKK